MSPTEFVVERMQREHLKRLRRSIGVTGYELPEEPTRRIGALAVACALGAVGAAWLLAYVVTQ